MPLLMTATDNLIIARTILGVLRVPETKKRRILMTNCTYFHCQFPNCPNGEIRSCGHSVSYLLEKVIQERNDMMNALNPYINSAINRLNTALDIVVNLKESENA
jgi:hypothetical protein